MATWPPPRSCCDCCGRRDRRRIGDGIGLVIAVALTGRLGESPGMEYVMSSRWSLMERFDITDGSGTPQFEARGHLGARISLLDGSGP